MGITGEGLAFRIMKNTTSSETDPLPSDPDVSLDLLGGRGEPHSTVRLPGQVGSQGLEVLESLLLGTVCCIQGSHISGSCDQVDDTDEGLEQGDRSCDPEAHSEKTHRAN